MDPLLSITHPSFLTLASKITFQVNSIQGGQVLLLGEPKLRQVLLPGISIAALFVMAKRKEGTKERRKGEREGGIKWHKNGKVNCGIYVMELSTRVQMT